MTASKETKDMNKKWVKKQGEIGKDWKSYYQGGFIIMGIMSVLLAGIVIYHMFIK